MRGNFLAGCRHLLVGFRLLTTPGIRRFVVLPLLINMLIFAAAIYGLAIYFEAAMAYLLAWLPDWLAFIESLLWVLFAVLMLVVVAFTFTLLANFIAAPFNGFLAEAVERHLSGQAPVGAQRSLAGEVVHGLAREWRKLRYYLPRVILLLVLGFIPLLNGVAPLLWALFSVWMMAMQYLDYPMDNNNVSFAGMRHYLARRRLTTFGYGGTVLLATLVPVLNLVVMPAAVAGATALWLDDYKPRVGKAET